jgi:hypothetical protein
VRHGAAVRDIADAQRDQVAATQLAVDREVEEREVTEPLRQLQANPDRPDLADLQRRLRAGQFAPVPGRTG